MGQSYAQIKHQRLRAMFKAMLGSDRDFGIIFGDLEGVG